MTLPSLQLRLDVHHSLHDCCGVEPDLETSLPTERLHRGVGTEELLPVSKSEHLNTETLDLPRMLGSTNESLVDIPLNSPKTNTLKHIALSPLPFKNDVAENELDIRDHVDASPTSLRQLDHESFHGRNSADGERCDMGITECDGLGEETNDPEIDTHPLEEICDKPSLQPIPPHGVPESKPEPVERGDSEIRSKEEFTSSPSACDEIIENLVSDPTSNTEDAETCTRSGSELDLTESMRRSPSSSKNLESSDCELGSSKMEEMCNTKREDDDVDEREVHTDTVSNVSRDRDTPAMSLLQSDISETKIAHSLSAPNFKTSSSTAASNHFDKGGLARTLSAIARVEPNQKCGEKVIIPEQDACGDTVQITEPRVSLEGGKESLSKLDNSLDIPETSGTMPSGCKIQSNYGEDVEKTNMSPASDDDLAIDIGRMDADHQDASMDSSSASLRQVEPPKLSLAHSTPPLRSVDSVCSSSDLEQVEDGEKITASPHEIKRTYSSSVDSLVEEDIETLTTTSNQHTIFSVTNSDASHPTSSSLLTSSNESIVQQRFVQSVSNVLDIERDPLSASSIDAEGAWREDHSFPRPHSRVKRMYSSSESSADSLADHEECIEISDSATEALANSRWDAYASECRRCSSAIERRDLERISRSGRLPHTGFTSSESMASMDSLPIQTAEAAPLLRQNSSRPVRPRRASEGRARLGMKSAFAKKAARLLNFVLGKKNRSGRGHPESQARVKKRSLSSFLCGRSS